MNFNKAIYIMLNEAKKFKKRWKVQDRRWAKIQKLYRRKTEIEDLFNAPSAIKYEFPFACLEKSVERL